ncbi:MAG: leucine--tRNA ligase [Candidatus Shapirobacteria bacterium]
MDFKVVEAKWQKFWEEHPELYWADDNIVKKKKYILVEFPYPSGSGLHVGHAFSFTGSDVYARFKRMQGYNVLFPMGWDAFGLPTENYAIKTKRKPQEVTKENTDMFRGQMKRLAYSFDWGREINTTDPNYYRWTQWIFIQLFNKGLAYKKEMPINWCPSCKIGLANEEVVDGKCERCGSEVERRTISQWVVKITEYADKLLSGLQKTDFIDKVRQAQINWIGKTSGVTIDYPIVDSNKTISCYSTRPDTNFGATFVVIAPEHERVMELTTEENKTTVEDYIKKSRKKSDMERTELQKEKTGVFTGSYCVNRLTGKKMPIWVSDFVVLTAGTGVVVGVPAHDQRDYDFAKKHNIEIIPVIVPKDGSNWDFGKGPYLNIDDALVTNSTFLNGMTAVKAKEKIINYLEEKKWGERSSNYHLRDWIFSRQHYWGEPIPMIYCKKDGWQPVLEKDLPIVLPEVEAYEPSEDGKSPLSKIESFLKCKCPICGGDAQRETDTMPNWAGSDWYYMAYCLVKKLKTNIEANDTFTDIFSDSQKELKKWCPVDVYVGGDEHNTLHLLYSRFIYLFLYDLGVLPKEIPEPYYTRISHGVILGSDNQRMSKSKGNVIVPETVADKFGVDVLRLYLMFMGPFEGTMAWNENTLMGVKRFLDRFYLYIDNQYNLNTDSSISSKVIISKTILGVSRDMESFGYNTAVAKLMEAINTMDKLGRSDLMILIKLMAPMAPYMAEELWEKIGGDGSVHQSEWPVAELKYLREDEVTLPVAVNGKVRGEIKIKNDMIQKIDEVIAMAKSLEKIKEWIDGKTIIREIYVSGKMVNLVVKE